MVNDAQVDIHNEVHNKSAPIHKTVSHAGGSEIVTLHTHLYMQA